jgi:hypothetical protein
MADSADLVVLGAWFGTGQKGKILLHGMHLSVPYYRIVYCFKFHCNIFSAACYASQCAILQKCLLFQIPL